MRTKHRFMACILLLLAAVCLFSCGKQGRELRIGYFNNITHSQALYMKASGILEDSLGEDCDISWQAFNAGPAEVEALFSASIDIGYIGPVPALMANARSEGDVSILSGAAEAGAVLLVDPDSGIKSVKDLEDRIVAIPQIANTQHLCLLALLEENGLAPEDQGGRVTVTAVENADVQNMMDQGNIDAALVPEPWGSLLEESGYQVLLDYDEIYGDGNYPVTVLVVRNDFLKENPDLVQAFLKVHEDASNALQKNPQRYSSLINKEIESATGKELAFDCGHSDITQYLLGSFLDSLVWLDGKGHSFCGNHGIFFQYRHGI